MDNMITQENLNVLPLGSYNVLIGMDWLEAHRAIINCLDKTFTCIHGQGNISQFIKGIYKLVTIRQISKVQLKKCVRKGCQFYVV